MNKTTKRLKILRCLSKRIIKACDQTLELKDGTTKRGMYYNIDKLHKRFMSIVRGE